MFLRHLSLTFSHGCPHGAYLCKRFLIVIPICCQLIRYQTFIVHFASGYLFTAWYNYEQMFRQLANNQSLRCDQLDEDLFNSQLHTANLRGQCYLCNRFVYFHSSCPLRNSDNTNLSSAKTNPNQIHLNYCHPSSMNSPDQDTCFKFIFGWSAG